MKKYDVIVIGAGSGLEAVVAMKTTGKISAISDSVYTHPALSEWLQRAFYSIE